MALTYTQEDIDRVNKRYVDTFEQLRKYNSQQIGDILVNAYNSGLLTICGGLFDEKDVDECYVALMIGIGMLKSNNILLPKKYLKEDNKEDNEEKSYNTNSIPEGATNGDVIMKLFPYDKQ